MPAINPSFPCMVFLFSILKYVGGREPSCYPSSGNFSTCPPNRHTPPPYCPSNSDGEIHNCPYDVLRHSWVNIGPYDTHRKMMSVALKNKIAQKESDIKFFAVGVQDGVSVAAYEIIKWNPVTVSVGEKARWGFEGVLNSDAKSLLGESFQKQQDVYPDYWRRNGGQFIIGFNGKGFFLPIKPKVNSGTVIGWQSC